MMDLYKYMYNKSNNHVSLARLNAVCAAIRLSASLCEFLRLSCVTLSLCFLTSHGVVCRVRADIDDMFQGSAAVF